MNAVIAVKRSMSVSITSCRISTSRKSRLHATEREKTAATIISCSVKAAVAAMLKIRLSTLGGGVVPPLVPSPVASDTVKRCVLA